VLVTVQTHIEIKVSLVLVNDNDVHQMLEANKAGWRKEDRVVHVGARTANFCLSCRKQFTAHISTPCRPYP